MSDIVRLLLIIILLTIGLVAYFLVTNTLFPQRVAKTKSIIQSMPARSLGVGLVNFVFFAVIAMVLFSIAENAGPFIKGILIIPAIVILAFLAIVLSLGLAGMSNLSVSGFSLRSPRRGIYLHGSKLCGGQSVCLWHVHCHLSAGSCYCLILASLVLGQSYWASSSAKNN